MITEGVAVKCFGSTATIHILLKGETCGQCHSCGIFKDGCHEEGLDVTLQTSGQCSPGDLVEADVTLPNQAVAGLIVYGLPLVCAFAVGLLGYLFFPSNVQVIGISGVAGLVLGFFCAGLAERGVAGLRPRGRVLRVVEKAAGL